ncbi:MAG: hypothetical protein R2867_05370 [Caldilineaceae bacterium]
MPHGCPPIPVIPYPTDPPKIPTAAFDNCIPQKISAQSHFSPWATYVTGSTQTAHLARFSS